ncbi:MAG: type II toxin-antitoxin system Phd/YefM family antitoxin [Chitinivibrionales bacterium]|nr:type II toxin-antitoxin system Phd/YefM family antitoxin [Chitinivibrionales bacterium]
MILNVTQFRQNMYKALDQVIETGIPLEINRKGKTLKVICEEPVSKLDNLKPHNIINGDPEDLAEISWEQEWKNEPI